jgi:hypothetical protein
MSLQLLRVQRKSFQLVRVNMITVSVDGLVDLLEVLMSIWAVFSRSEDRCYFDFREIQL